MELPMAETVYQKLAEHLDRLPGRFGQSETDAHLRLLERLFTPLEAELAIHLRLDREDAQNIASRSGLPVEDVELLLAEMAHKGLILSVVPEDGPVLYQAVPMAIGIYEFQVNRMDEGFVEALEEYWRTMKPREPVQTIPQMRTIPIEESIDPQLQTLPYEQVGRLVAAHDRFAVAPCLCRRQARIQGEPCDAPEESCLMFGDFADYYVRDGRGRAIDRGEVLEIIARADAANLVLQPTNSQYASAICCCCGCCCGVLRGLKQHPKPAEAVASSFIARLEPDLCLGCWDCLERCQMEAFSEQGDRVAHNADRCIGCGLCVSTCPSGALALARKPGSAQVDTPATLDDAWREIVTAQDRARD
jgi:Pyruvate/2-oxoacid:ferredoxin oxidoreductase delta subunit